MPIAPGTPPPPDPDVWSAALDCGSRGRERGAELPARGEVEFAVDPTQMLFDRLHRHVQLLRDLLVAQVLGRHLRNPPFAGRKGVQAAALHRPGVGAGGGEFLVRPGDQRSRPAPMRELDPVTQSLTRLAAVVAAAQRRAEVDECPRML